MVRLISTQCWDFSLRSIGLLLEYGFEWDSSLMGSDFFPYYARKGDRWSVDEPYVFGEATSLVELPVTWGLDDFPPFEFILGSNTASRRPRRSRRSGGATSTGRTRTAPAGSTT